MSCGYSARHSTNPLSLSLFTAAAIAAEQQQQQQQVASTAAETESVAQAEAPIETSVVHVEPTALQMTMARLDAMEDELLNAQANKEPTPPNTLLKPVAPLPEKKGPPLLQQAQGQAPLSAAGGGAAAAGMQNSPLKYSSVLNRPAAGRVGANQKTATAPQATAPTVAGLAKVANGGKMTTTTTTTITKPATAATLRRNNNNNNNVNNVNVNNVKPFGGGSRTSARFSAPLVANAPPRPSSKTECYGPPNNVASRLSARSRTMLDMNGNAVASTTSSLLTSKPLTKRTPGTLLTHTGKRVSVPSNSSSSVHRQLSSREDIASSTSTLKASNEQLSSSRSTIKLDDRHSEPKQLHPDANDGWLTVKNRRRSSMHWANRFNQPTGYASLPTLALLNEQKEEKDKREKAAAAAAVATRAAKSSVASKAPKAANKSGKSVAPPATRPEIKNAKAKVNSFPVQRTAAQLKKQDKEKELEKSKDKEQRENDRQREQDKERQKDKLKEQDKPKDKEHKDAEKEKDTKEKLKPTAVAGAATLARSSSNCSSARTTHLIKRQKSDLTGLKMTSLHKEYMRSEKNALRKQQKEQKEQSNNVVTNVANGDGE